MSNVLDIIKIKKQKTKTKERLQKKTHGSYQNLSKEEIGNQGECGRGQYKYLSKDEKVELV